MYPKVKQLAKLTIHLDNYVQLIEEDKIVITIKNTINYLGLCKQRQLKALSHLH